MMLSVTSIILFTSATETVAQNIIPSTDIAVVVIDMQPLFFYSKRGELQQYDHKAELKLQDLARTQRRVIDAVVAYQRHRQNNFDGSLYGGVFFTEFVLPENLTEVEGNVWSLNYDRSHAFIQPRDVMHQRVLEMAETAEGQGLFERLGCDNMQCSADQRVDLLIRTMPEFGDMVEQGAQRPSKPGAGAFGPGSELPLLLDDLFAKAGSRGHCSQSDSDNPDAQCSSNEEIGEASSQKNLKTLIVMGIETDYCVLATVLGAMDAGYHVVVVEDGCASSREEAGKAQFQYTFRSFGDMIKVVSSEDLVQMLRS